MRTLQNKKRTRTDNKKLLVMILLAYEDAERNVKNGFWIIMSFKEKSAKLEQTMKRSMNIRMFSHFSLKEVLKNLGCLSTKRIERKKQRIAIKNTYRNWVSIIHTLNKGKGCLVLLFITWLRYKRY